MSFPMEACQSVSKYILNFLKKILNSFESEKKVNPPPSSYPGIWKYPTDRDKPLRIAEQWLESKRKDDDTQGLWRVYDKLYDLTPFISRHPGGSQWLEISRGTDITEVFESSHVANTTKVKKILAKYIVRDLCPIQHPRISPYTLKPDGFYMTLKRRVEPIFQTVGTGPTNGVKLFQDSLLISFLIFEIIGASHGSLLMAIISGICSGFCAICAHNFVHLKENWRKYYFDLCVSCSYDWRITHTFSHHAYANTVLDLELSFLPNYEFLPNRPKSWHLKNIAVFYSPILYLFGSWAELGKRIYNICNGRKKLRWENLLPFVELFVLGLISGGNWAASFLTWFVVRSVSSFVFLTVGATAAHHHPDIFHDGDEPLKDPDFGICQLDATRDRAESIFSNTYIALISFGRHPLHHLFPTVCHSKLDYIRPVFEQTLKEFQINYPGISQKDLFFGCYKQLARTDIKKRRDVAIKADYEKGN